MYPPEDLAQWFNGEVAGLEGEFELRLKSEALASLKRQDSFSDCQYDPNARLPARWHEGQKPWPFYWSIQQWNWIAAGAISTRRYPLSAADKAMCCRELHVGQSHRAVILRA
jgi:hypothetical protein